MYHTPTFVEWKTYVYGKAAYEDSQPLTGEAMVIDHTGYIVCSHKNFWGTTFLLVLDDDNNLQEVRLSEVKVVDR